MAMRTLKILVTHPSTSSTSPSVIYPSSSSSTLTEGSSSSSTEIGAEEPRDVVNPLPPVPPKDVRRPNMSRRNTDTTATTNTSIRSADDLLTQVGVLRNSANAARERRSRFRGERTVHDRSHDEDSGNGMRARRRDSRPSSGPKPPRKAEHAQVQIDAQKNNRVSALNESPVNPSSFSGGPNDARRVQLHCLTPDSSSSWYSEKHSEKEKRGCILRAPASFIKRFLCLKTFSCTGQNQLHSPGPVHRTDSLTGSTRFDKLLREPNTTRRINLRPRSSIVSPCVLDIRP